MTLIQLQSLCLIAREGSFSRAADKLFVTQPALSMQMKALERELGQELLDRSGNRVTLTHAGAVLVERVKSPLADLDDAVQAVSRVGGLEHGILSIGSSDTIGEFFLLPILARFAERHPGISIVVHNKPTVQLGELVMDNVAEVGLITLPVGTPQLASRPVFSYRELALCTREHPLSSQQATTLKQLAGHRLLLLPHGTRSRMLQERDLARAGVVPSSVMELGSVHLQKAFASYGLGVAIVPEYAVRTEVSNGTIVGVGVKGLSTRSVGIIYREKRPFSAAARAFLEMVDQEADAP